jgi:hypothetical protein
VEEVGENAEVVDENTEEKGKNNVEAVVTKPAGKLAPVAAVSISEKTKVNRPQRSSIADFNNTLSILKKDSKRLKQANVMTENLLNLSVVSIDAFKNALQLDADTSSRYNKATPLGMFRWAVHRIVLQRYVEAVRVRLDTLNESQRPIRINGTFPAPGSTDMQSPQAKILSLAGRLNATPHMQSLSETLSRETTPRRKNKTTKNIAHSALLPLL